MRSGLRMSPESYLKAHLLRATLSVKFLLAVREVLALEAATRVLAVLAINDIIGLVPTFCNRENLNPRIDNS